MMKILITEWALNTYLELKGNAFTEREFKEKIRPDVLRLLNYPNDNKFFQGKFWSKATDQNGKIIRNGYKMKWHQLGDGLVQLRLTIGIFDEECFLCEAYVKENEKKERRMLARFKTYLQLINLGKFKLVGEIK